MTDWPWRRVWYGVLKWALIFACTIAFTEAWRDRNVTDVLIAKVQAESREMYKYKLDSAQAERQERYSERRRKERGGKR